MFAGNIWTWFLAQRQALVGQDVRTASPAVLPFRFGESWSVLGPFQSGTREIAWGSDPLEFHGGFRALEYDSGAIFRSSLAVNGSLTWCNITGSLTESTSARSGVELLVDFPNIEWENLRSVYGWSAYQWQAWARGEIIIQADEIQTLSFSTPQIIEFWVDDTQYFGGDFYSYNRAPTILRLEPGRHRIDVRLGRDIRSMGGNESGMLISLVLSKSYSNLLQETGPRPLISDAIISSNVATLVSPFASVVLRNVHDRDVYVEGIEGQHDACFAELWSEGEIRLVPGQSRPIPFRVKCVFVKKEVSVTIKYRIDGRNDRWSLIVRAEFTSRQPGEPHKVTFPHPGGTVSYAILRSPSQKVIDDVGTNVTLPVFLGLHGAGVEAEWDSVRLAMEPLPDLPAWVLFPTGSTSWSGDDWHAWGFPDVEAAVEMIPDWIEVMGWTGPGVEPNKWIVAGHSNGGQGTWYALTHRPDKVTAAAPLSGYSSITNYVPYTFWAAADPGRTAVVQSALLSYKHDLLLSNAQGIPVLQQHGGADDNVPPYHSRLQSQLVVEAGADSNYFEIPGKPHVWDGVFTTNPLKDFYHKHARSAIANTTSSLLARSFSLVVANPADTGPKNGVQIINLHVPGQLGRIDVMIDPITVSCSFRTSNIRMFFLSPYFRDCSLIEIDGQTLSLPLTQNYGNWTFTREVATPWSVSAAEDPTSSIPPRFRRFGRQLGQMDSILRAEGVFQIVQHSNEASHVALQIANNFCQYFSASASITSDYDSAIGETGNIISVAIGSDLPPGLFPNHPIQILHGEISVRNDRGASAVYKDIFGLGLAAIYLRPLPLGRLELVVWASDEAMLRVAARLVPIMPGSGQPDFVIADKTMLAKGLEGTLALGFFDNFWEVSTNAFFE